MSQATARMSVGALFGTVVNAAETVSGALNTVNNAVGMLNAYVENAASEQQARILNDKATFVIRLVDEGAQSEANVHLNALSFRKKSADHATLYDTAYAKYARIHGLKLAGETQIEDNTTNLRVAAE